MRAEKALPDASRTEAHKIARNSLLLGVGDAIAMAMGFVTTILVTDYLGENYGVFIGAQRFTLMFLVIAEFGLAPLLIRRIAKNRATAGTAFTNVLMMQTGLCMLYGLVTMAAAVSIDYLPEHRVALLLLVAVNVLGVFASTQAGLFEGFELMGRASALAIARAVATLAGVSVAVLSNGGLEEIIFAYLVARSAQILLGVGLSFRMGVVRRLSPKFNDMRVMLREALLFVVAGAAYMALRSIDVVMLSHIAGAEETARYGAALNFIEVTLPLIYVAQRSLLPAFSRLGERSEGEGVARDTLHVFSALLVPAAIGLAILASEALKLYPNRTFDDSANVLSLLSISLLPLGPIVVCAIFLTGFNRMWTLILAYMLTLPILVIANAFLIPMAGAEGAAIATLLAHGMLAVILLRAVRLLGVEVPVAAFLRHMVAGLVMAGTLVALAEFSFPLVVMAGTIVYFATLFAITGRDSLEHRIMAMIGDSLRRLR